MHIAVVQRGCNFTHFNVVTDVWQCCSDVKLEMMNDDLEGSGGGYVIPNTVLGTK